MRPSQICLISILLMLGSRWAFADTKPNCATFAADGANINVKDVNLWLSRYRGTYASCLAEKATAVEASGSASDSTERNRAEPSTIKSPNKKAVFRSAKVNSQPKILETSKVIKSTAKQKREKLAASKKSKSIAASRLKTPLSLPIPASTRVQKTNPIKSVGIEGWRINCSARFGGWDKASKWYISNAGKRVSCANRP